MDYFQGVVAKYLRADRSCFINPEFLIRGNELKPYDKPHWYVDVLANHHAGVDPCLIHFLEQKIAGFPGCGSRRRKAELAQSPSTYPHG